MASKYCKDDKPGLVALFRLEFYKNKKNWKLSKEQPENRTQSLEDTSDAERGEHTNEDSVKGTSRCQNSSLLDKAFIDDMPSNDIPLPEPLSIMQLEHEKIDRMLDLPTKCSDTNQMASSQSLTEIQVPSIYHHPSSIMQQSATEYIGLQGEINNNLWSESLNTNRCHNPLQNTQENSAQYCPQIPQAWNDDNLLMTEAQSNVPYFWNNLLPSNNPNLDQNTWVDPAIVSTHLYPNFETNMAETDRLKQLLLPNKWQIASTETQNNQGDQNLNSQNLNQNLYFDQNQNFVNIFKDNCPDLVGQQTILCPNTGNIYGQQIHAEEHYPGNRQQQDYPHLISENLCTCQGFPITPSGLCPINLYPPPDVMVTPILTQLDPFWSDNTLADCQNEQNNWINPALIASTEQNELFEQTWQQQEDLWQNIEQEWRSAQPISMSMYEDNSSMPQVTEAYSAQTSEDIYQEAPADPIQQVQDLIRTYLEKDMQSNTVITGEVELGREIDSSYRYDEMMGGEQHQDGLNESLEFIFGAHYGPHSSEKDSNDTNEIENELNTTTTPRTPRSSRLLAAMKELPVATLLLNLIREQKHLQQNRHPVSRSFEYPTRDTDPYYNDCILDGSHLPHCTALLETNSNPTQEGAILINNGRPYRL